MTQFLDFAKIDPDYCRSLSTESEGELLLDRVTEMVRGIGSDELAVASGISRDGMILVATGTRDLDGGIDFDLWELPAAGWDPARFVIEFQIGRLS